MIQKVNQIVQQLPDELTHGTSPRLIEAACWPDDIKVFGFEGTNPWHFVDRPNNPYGYVNITTLAFDNRVDWAISESINTLKSGSSYPYIESTMMRYLIHFVGDSHQPLHTTSQFSP